MTFRLILPYRLVDLMKLLEVCAEPYWRLAGMIGQLICYLSVSERGIPVSDDFPKYVGATLGEMQREMEKLELKGPLKQLRRFRDAIDLGELTWPFMRKNLEELHSRMCDDLESRLFLAVPEDVMDYYQQKEPLFGKEVENKFSNMSEDISEAGKCMALNRPTATVFHLMRIMEIAVQQFGDKLGVKLVQETNWQVILDQINSAIRKMNPKDKKTMEYAEAASHLYNVKVSWRNNVMHPKQTYTPDEARAIFTNVKTFVRNITEII